jgi:hypothetical protein
MKREDEIRKRYQAKLEESWRTLERDIEERRKSSNAFTANIARISPVSCFIRPLAELSRTGWLEYEKFNSGVRQYEEVLNREIFNKQDIRHYGLTGIGISNSADPDAPAPVFSYVPTPEESIVRNVLPDVVLLLLFNLVFFAGAFVAFLRYDAR